MVTGQKYINKAYSAIINKDYRQAIYYFNKAIDCEPNNASYRYKLSITYARNSNFKKALEEAEKAIQLNPNMELYRQHYYLIKSMYLTKRAYQHLEIEEDIDQSINMLEEATTLNPLNLDAKILLSEIYRKKGEYTQALHLLREVIQLQPQHPLARKYLNKWYQQ